MPPASAEANNAATSGPPAVPVLYEDEAERDRITSGLAAQLLGVSPGTLRSWTNHRLVKLYAVTPTGRYIYLYRDILTLKAQMRAEAEARLLRWSSHANPK